MTYTYSLYGLTIAVPFPCPMLPTALLNSVPDITVVEGTVPHKLAVSMAEDQNWQAAPGSFLLRGGRRAGRFLVEGGDRIILERNPAADESRLCAFLLTSVIAALLHQRGLLVLHANVVVTSKGAVAIAGESGSGKSTTQAALVARDCYMLSDDVTVLQLGKDGQVFALPGVPKMNLCEDAAIKLGHDVDKLQRNPLQKIKVYIPAPNDATRMPVPLRAIYQLRKHPGDDLVITPLSGFEKFTTLQECIYGPVFPEEHPGMFSLTTVVTKQINMFRLDRPSKGCSVNEVVEAILRG